VVVEDFGIYLTPQQAQDMLEEAAEKMADDEGGWSNPFVMPCTPRSLVDVHRMIFKAERGAVSAGVELVYGCGQDGCVSPAHAVEKLLPDDHDWSLCVIEAVRSRPHHVELRVSAADGSSRDIFVEWGLLERYGLADLSMLPERLVLVSSASKGGWVRLVPAARRMDYGLTSIADGWEHPGQAVADDQPCPCGSRTPYSDCHGSQLDFES